MELIKALSDVRDFIKELKEYYALKNKVLFTSGSGWTTGTKTIKNISKYRTVIIYTWDGLNGVLLERVSNTRIHGGGMVQGVSSAGIQTTVDVDLACNGDTVTLKDSRYLHHQTASNHGAIATIGILKIVGVDPMISKTLGGARRNPVWRWSPC